MPSPPHGHNGLGVQLHFIGPLCTADVWPLHHMFTNIGAERDLFGEAACHNDSRLLGFFSVEQVFFSGALKKTALTREVQ